MMTWKELFAASSAWHESPCDPYINNVLADHCEESGKLDRACAYRSLAMRKCGIYRDTRYQRMEGYSWDLYMSCCVLPPNTKNTQSTHLFGAFVNHDGQAPDSVYTKHLKQWEGHYRLCHRTLGACFTTLYRTLVYNK